MVVFGAAGLNQGLWYDEIVTLVESVRPPLTTVLTEYRWNNKHPLYSLAAHFSVSTFGEHAWSLRLPALVFGAACVPMSYVLARRVTNQREAMFVSLLLAVSYHHIWFSQNARGYTALLFWAMLSTYYLMNGLLDGKLGSYVGFGIASALGVYTHLTMVFVVFAHAIVVALALAGLFRKGIGPQNKRFIAYGFAIAGLLSLVMYAPLLLQVRQFFERKPDGVGVAVATPLWAFWEALRGLEIGISLVGVVFAALLVAIGLLSYWRQGPMFVALFVLPGLTLAGVAIAMGRPMFPRFFYFLAGFALIVLVRGAFAIVPGWVRPRSGEWSTAVGSVLLVLFAGGSIYKTILGAGLPKQDFEGAMHFVDGAVKDNEPVLTAGLAAYPYDKYFNRLWSQVRNLDELNNAQVGQRPVWLIYTFPVYLERESPQLINAIRTDYEAVRVFPGTVAGGDVIVARKTPNGTGN